MLQLPAFSISRLYGQALRRMKPKYDSHLLPLITNNWGNSIIARYFNCADARKAFKQNRSSTATPATQEKPYSNDLELIGGSVTHISARSLKWKGCKGLESKTVVLARLWVQISAYQQAEAMKGGNELAESAKNDESLLPKRNKTLKWNHVTFDNLRVTEEITAVGLSCWLLFSDTMRPSWRKEQ